MKDRLAEVLRELKYAGLVKNQTDFAFQVGYVKTYFSQIMNGAEPITERLAIKLETKFGISKDWLMNGRGEMFSDGAVKLSASKEVIPIGKHAHTKLKPEEYKDAFSGWEGLPMYNMPITASFIETYRDSKELAPQYYLYDPRFKDCNFGAIITGDSMHAEIRHGDFVVCQEIMDRSFIVYGDIYYVVATNGLETCKYVNADPRNDGNLLLVARNEKISPSPIPKEMILKMFKVRGIVRGY